MADDGIAAMLTRLEEAPADLALRKRTAEALADRGRRAEALEVLAPLINFTGHDDDGPLPCLCKSCLRLAPDEATASDMAFVPGFAVVGRRVLHYWTLVELGHQRDVRRSVQSALEVKLKAQARARR